MTNTYAVCLLALICFTGWSTAIPKDCHRGPSIWCASIRQASECGALEHCVTTIWDKQNIPVTPNGIANKFIRFFRQLKDIRELINEEYLATRIASECSDIQHLEISRICKENTNNLQKYIFNVLQSDTTPETMCALLHMCNNEKIDNVLTGKKPQQLSISQEKLIGASRCTWGPSYWCNNFSTGRECKATTHCIKRVWPKLYFPKDNDSICQICTDMVKQARDQLQSNETQEELKEVFEGSCKLIPIKIVAGECIKLADDFVPELVETLASQMNPQAVCSVAGLCNNARIDMLLEGYNHQLQLRKECSNCEKVVSGMRRKFYATSDEEFILGLLQLCRRMSSLSDSCSMLVFKYYENIVAALRKDLTPQSLCHVSGQCSHKYHEHPDYNFADVVINPKDDVPCELCEQLVVHLRDILIANTTELEFSKVLKGLCKQTGSFKEECLHLAEEYYPMIYKYLVDELKGDVLCGMIGMCGNTTKLDPVFAPMVPREMAVKILRESPELVATNEKNSYKTDVMARLPVKKQSVVVVEPSVQSPLPLGALPIERMFVTMPKVDGKAACSFCQYFLHYLQVEISDTRNEDQIINAVHKACDRLPASVNAECQQFVTQYGPAVIALLLQEIDPASVCPALGICPQLEMIRKVEVNSEKSNCPLCLFAVEQLETMLQKNHSEARIRQALDNLCGHLSAKLRTECVDFVDSYSDQLVEMLVANMNSQEICVFLKLCKNEVRDPLQLSNGQIDKFHEKPHLRGDMNNIRKKSLLPKPMLLSKNRDVETNEIYDNTVNGREVRPPVSQKTVCVVCEFVMKEIDEQIKDRHNEDEIKKVIHNVCRHMPKSVRSECDQFVEKYADMVISLLAQELDPSEVCQKLKLCEPASLDAVKEEILDCAVCETVVMAVQKVLNNDRVDRNIVHIVEKSCSLLPAKYYDRCHVMMEIYGDSVIHLIEKFGTKAVCAKIGMCPSSDGAYVHMEHSGKRV